MVVDAAIDLALLILHEFCMNLHLELPPITLSGQVPAEHELIKKSLNMDAATDPAPSHPFSIT